MKRYVIRNRLSAMKKTRLLIAAMMPMFLIPMLASFEVYSDESNKHVIISNDTLVMVWEHDVYFTNLSPVFAACRVNRQEYLADPHSKLISVNSFDSPVAIALTDTVLTYKPHRHGGSDSIEITLEFPDKYEFVVFSTAMRESICFYDSQCHFRISQDRHKVPLDISLTPLTGFPSTDVAQYFGIYTYHFWGIKVIPDHDITLRIPSLTPSLVNERFLHNVNLLIENDTLSVYYYKFYRNREPADSLRKYLNPDLWPRNYRCKDIE